MLATSPAAPDDFNGCEDDALLVPDDSEGCEDDAVPPLDSEGWEDDAAAPCVSEGCGDVCRGALHRRPSMCAGVSCSVAYN